jgi:hypothetical protein
MLVAGIMLTLLGIITVGFSVFDSGRADLALQRCQQTEALSAQDYGEQQTTLWYAMGIVIGIGMFALGLAFFKSSALVESQWIRHEST